MEQLESCGHNVIYPRASHIYPTTRKLSETLPEWKANLILHAPVVVGPLELSRVDFGFLQNLPTDSLGLNVYNLKGRS